MAQYDEALDDLATVITTAEASGLPGFAAIAYQQRARLLRIKGDLDGAEASATEARARFAAIGDLAGQAQALMVLGEVYSDHARLADFEAVSREALDLARRASDVAVEARALVLVGTAEIYQGRMEQGREPIQQAVAVYRRGGDQRGTASSLLMLARVDHALGHLGQAVVALEEAGALFNALGDRRAQTATAYSLGQINLERGNLDEALADAERGVALTTGVDDPAMTLRCAILRAQVLLDRGDAAGAASGLTEAEVLATSSGLASILPEFYRTMGQAKLALQDVAEAGRYVERAVQTASSEDAFSRGTSTLVAALVAEQQRRRDVADAAFRSALEALEQADETYELGWAHRCYGEFLAGVGTAAPAVEQLEAAREAFVQLESSERVAHIDALLARIR